MFFGMVTSVPMILISIQLVCNKVMVIGKITIQQTGQLMKPVEVGFSNNVPHQGDGMVGIGTSLPISLSRIILK